MVYFFFPQLCGQYSRDLGSFAQYQAEQLKKPDAYTLEKIKNRGYTAEQLESQFNAIPQLRRESISLQFVDDGSAKPPVGFWAYWG